RTWHTFSPGTRFLKSLYALTALVRLTATMPAIAIAIVLVLDAFALLPPRIMEIGLGLVAAIAVASFGRGVAVALFAPSEPERRLPQLADIVAPLYAGHLTWAARILGAGIFFNVMQKALVAPLSLTVATSAVLAILIAILLGHLSWRIARCEAIPDDAPGGQWAGGAGWVIAAAVVVALATGYVGFAAFLATRLIAAVAAVGTLYILLVFVDSLFGETLTANSRYGRAVGHFFGIKPRSVELIGTLLSAALRILLILVAAFPMLGPWGIFASDFFSVLRDAVFGFRVGDVTISLVAILTAFAIVFVGVLLTRGMQSWLTSRFLPRTTLDPGLQHSVSTILGYVAMLAVLAVALAALGIDLQKITLVAGALSIGIGFGLQSVVSNFVSGLILLAERPIRVGDIINVKGEEGAVRRIHVRATEIETADRASVIIPNSELITGVVKNWTHANTLSRIIIKVGVDYDSDVEKVREILLAVAHEHPVVVQTPAPVVLLTGFGDSAINFELSGVVRNIAEAAIVKSDLYFEILKRFRAAGIEIPYPQQVTWQGDIQPPVRSRRPRKRT
ncbi:MAG: mechanosensitive ion channel domain-containing protein, partial [Pseudorhodoplanes sp.]